MLRRGLIFLLLYIYEREPNCIVFASWTRAHCTLETMMARSLLKSF
jgi:hypothetical protein